jgi:hypothetical protein
MNSKTNIIIGGLVIALLAFYGGTLYASKKATNQNRNGSFGQFTTGTNRLRQAGSGGMGGFTGGEISTIDDKSLTVKMPDGSSKLVFFSTSTEVMKTDKGDLSDLKTGENVVVTGVPNSDGSITAQSVQLRPAGMVQFRRAQ